MYDRQELLDRLKDVLEALERIPRRSESIHSADDFLVDEAGLEHLDSICMLLVAVGEAFRQMDAKTKGDWLARYPKIPWRERDWRAQCDRPRVLRSRCRTGLHHLQGGYSRTDRDCSGHDPGFAGGRCNLIGGRVEAVARAVRVDHPCEPPLVGLKTPPSTNSRIRGRHAHSDIRCICGNSWMAVAPRHTHQPDLYAEPEAGSPVHREGSGGCYLLVEWSLYVDTRFSVVDAANSSTCR